MFEIIKKGQLPDYSQPWSDLSKGAQNIIRKVLEVDPSKRYKVDDILQDPWFDL